MSTFSPQPSYNKCSAVAMICHLVISHIQPSVDGWIYVPCYAVLLQSLFHLPVFRRLVLNYHLSEKILEKCKSHSVSKLLSRVYTEQDNT